MMKIAILGLHYDTNQGDPLICQTVKKIFSREAEQSIEWKDVDLRWYFTNIPITPQNWIFKKCYGATNRILAKHPTWFLYKLRIFFLALVFCDMIKGSNGGIIAGGGIIHWKKHDFATGISAFILACRLKNVPVIVNAVGVEGFNKDSYRSKALMEFLNYPNVKYVSTRDDLETISDKYINTSIRVEEVPDPAIFSAKFFEIKAKKDCNTIGIGLIRGSIFYDFHVNYSVGDIVGYYSSLAKRLSSQGYRIEFFINGFKGDLDIVPLIEAELQHSITVRNPKTPEELIQIISGYKAIITARMHSCIVAYSLGVPAIAFKWCEKLDFWGKKIGKPNCYIDINELTVNKVLDILKAEEGKDYDSEIRNQLERSYIDSVHTCLGLFGIPYKHSNSEKND